MTEFLTSLSATSSAFASGSDAGTSFKNFLARLVPQSKQASAAMAELGLEFFDAEGQMKSMDEIAEELKQGIAGLSEVSRNSSLQTIFGTDAIRTALALADVGGAGFRDLAKGLSEVSAQEQAEVRLQGLEGALKEVSAAWEALQLESAQSGGLDVAEATVDRLTEALRYLAENFPLVEEAASRVAQALTVVLVGRGIKFATTQAIAMRAAYIELAGQVTGVGTAASRSIGPLTRLGVVGRALTGVLGGPLSLAITAASLLAFGLDTDRASDALTNSKTASGEAASAIDAYAKASRQAAEEQGKLGGKVSATTAQLLQQGRAAVQVALDNQRAAQEELLATAQGAGLLNSDHVARAINDIYRAAGDAWIRSGAQGAMPEINFDTMAYENLGPVFDQVVESLEAIRSGDKTFQEISKELQIVAGAGEEALSAIELLDNAMAGVAASDLDTAREHLAKLAQQIGGFDRELDAIGNSKSEFELVNAYQELRMAMQNAAAAGKLLRKGGEEGVLGLVEALAKGELKLDDLRSALDDTWNASKEKPEKTFVEQISDDADVALKKLDKIRDAHREYAKSRMVGGVPESSNRVLKQVASASDGTEASAQILRFFEGFRATPYWDVNANRVGYGSDTVTLADGTVRQVTEGMRVSVQDANRDLVRRIGEFHTVIVGKLGRERFEQLTPAQQGVVTSLVYNYGQGEFSETGDLKEVLAALRNGSNPDVAQSIRGLRNHNGGVNSGRRLTEARVFSQNVGAVEQADRTQKETQTALEQRKRAAEAQAKALQDLIAAGKEQEAQLSLEISLTGKTASEQARLTYVHQALTQAKQAGFDVDTKVLDDGRRLIDVINEQADAIAKRTEAQSRGSETSDSELRKIQESSDAVRSAFDNFKRGGEGWRGFLDDLLGHITDKLWDMAFDPVWDFLGQLIESAFANIGSGFGPLPQPAAATGAGLQTLATGGRVQIGGRASGRIKGAGHRRQDNILLWGSRDEFMQPAAAVDHYGLDFMEAIRNRRLPRLADGGSLGGQAATVWSRAGAPDRSGDTSIVFNDYSAGVAIEQKETRDADGNRSFEFELSDRVGAAITKPGGGAAKTFRHKYGLGPKGTKR